MSATKKGFSDGSQTSSRSSVTSTSSNEIPVQAENQITISFHDNIGFTITEETLTKLGRLNEKDLKPKTESMLAVMGEVDDGGYIVFDELSLEIPELPEIGWIPEKPKVRRLANRIIEVASAVDIPRVPEALIMDVGSAVDIPPVPEAQGELRFVDCFKLFDMDTMSDTDSDRSELAGTLADETALMPQKHVTIPFDLNLLDQK
jgi:hypothetical protein